MSCTMRLCMSMMKGMLTSRCKRILTGGIVLPRFRLPRFLLGGRYVVGLVGMFRVVLRRGTGWAMSG